MSCDEIARALAARDWPKAERLLRRIAAKVGAPAAVYYGLGKVRLEQGDAAQSIAAFRRALAANRAMTWLANGRMPLRLG